MANFTYLVSDEKTDECAIVDPSWDLEVVMSAIKKNGLKPKFIINTHSHFDHVLGNEQMAKLTGAKIIQHRNSELAKDIAVDDGQTISIGDTVLRVLHTPGHSQDSICLILDGQYVLTGDTLFVGNCGRVDLPGSDPVQMYESLYQKVAALDENLVVYPGHNYGTTPTSTIGNEKKNNFVLHLKSESDFVAFMSHGD
jgi:glyoxylase-like metal-dependent hydrolase (beta-lactamase superfamily II)